MDEAKQPAPEETLSIQQAQERLAELKAKLGEIAPKLNRKQRRMAEAQARKMRKQKLKTGRKTYTPIYDGVHEMPVAHLVEEVKD